MRTYQENKELKCTQKVEGIGILRIDGNSASEVLSCNTSMINTKKTNRIQKGETVTSFLFQIGLLFQLSEASENDSIPGEILSDRVPNNSLPLVRSRRSFRRLDGQCLLGVILGL